jgi:hypothetical protein
VRVMCVPGVSTSGEDFCSCSGSITFVCTHGMTGKALTIAPVGTAPESRCYDAERDCSGAIGTCELPASALPPSAQVINCTRD